jgi:hypothetical protein
VLKNRKPELLQTTTGMNQDDEFDEFDEWTQEQLDAAVGLVRNADVARMATLIGHTGSLDVVQEALANGPDGGEETVASKKFRADVAQSVGQIAGAPFPDVRACEPEFLTDVLKWLSTLNPRS